MLHHPNCCNNATLAVNNRLEPHVMADILLWRAWVAFWKACQLMRFNQDSLDPLDIRQLQHKQLIPNNTASCMFCDFVLPMIQSLQSCLTVGSHLVNKKSLPSVGAHKALCGSGRLGTMKLDSFLHCRHQDLHNHHHNHIQCHAMSYMLSPCTTNT